MAVKKLELGKVYTGDELDKLCGDEGDGSDSIGCFCGCYATVLFREMDDGYKILYILDKNKYKS